MKKKYLVTIILIIAAIAIGTICFPFLRRQKEIYEHSRMESEASKAFEEMVIFCEKNQNEIEAYSSRYLTMKNPDMSYEELGKLEKQIEEELDCKWMFEEISVRYSGQISGKDGVILYNYKKFEHIDYEYEVICSRTIEIFYVEEEVLQQEFEEMYFNAAGPYILCELKKINAHLYVCITGYACV